MNPLIEKLSCKKNIAKIEITHLISYRHFFLQDMAQNLFIQESLDQFTRRNLRIYVMMNSFYYTIKNTVLNRLFEKYIFNTRCYFEEHKKLKRLNLCTSILKNPRLIFAEDTVHQLLSLCPNDNWKHIINSEFDNYKSYAPIELKQLFRLKHTTFGELWKSHVYEMFHTEIIHQTKHIRDLLCEVYVELHTRI